MCVNSGLEAYMRKSTKEDISGKGGQMGGGARGREGRTASAGKICRRLFKTGLE